MGERGRLPALDAVRGLAILLVVADHAGLPTGRSGPVGVSVFFVLSGYLITRVLLERPGWRVFYLRRAARLLPALLFMLALFAAATLAMGSTAVVEHAPPVLLYVGNWWQVAGGTLGGLNHTWSLAVEEQFYLAWPVVLAVVPRRWLPHALAVVVVVSLALRGTVGGEHAYMGTDTNAYALALGGLLVLAPRAPGWLTPVGLAVLLIAPFAGSDVASGTVGAAGGVALVAARSLPAPRWLRHCGAVSYGWYLWHYPVVGLLTFPGDPDPLGGPVGVLVALGLAEVSWRLVERPALRWSHRLDQHDPVVVARA